ncbi:MAG: hypothetical protein ABFD76_15430 [Smithella sp.]
MKTEDMNLIEESIRGAISGIDGIDSLLADGGYAEDSSARHHLAIVRSMLTGQICKIKALEDYKTDIEESTKLSMTEMCGDERHCTCVPLLKAKVKELEEYKIHNYDPAESIRLNSEVVKLTAENASLKSQAERLKCCGNCRYYREHECYCFHNWEAHKKCDEKGKRKWTFAPRLK